MIAAHVDLRIVSTPGGQIEFEIQADGKTTQRFARSVQTLLRAILDAGAKAPGDAGRTRPDDEQSSE